MRFISRARATLAAVLLTPALLASAAAAQAAPASNLWSTLTKAHPVGHGWVARHSQDVPCGAFDAARGKLICVGTHSLVAGNVALHRNAVTRLGRVQLTFAGRVNDTYLFGPVTVDGKPVVVHSPYWGVLECSARGHSCHWQLVQG